MLNRDRIRALAIVESLDERGLRTSSYDVRIGKILTTQGKEETFFTLKPQQMAVVVSSERVKLPETIAGYAMPKTSLCNKGIVALSTGIIDPNYEGLVSSILINFGSASYDLSPEERFLRLTFHDVSEPKEPVAPPIEEDDKYVQRRKQVAQSLPDTFLDIKEHVSEIADKVLARQINWILMLFGFAAFALAIFVFIAPYANQYFTGDLKDDVANEIRVSDIEPMDDRVGSLEVELSEARSANEEQQLRIADLEERLRGLQAPGAIQ